MRQSVVNISLFLAALRRIPSSACDPKGSSLSWDDEPEPYTILRLTGGPEGAPLSPYCFDGFNKYEGAGLSSLA